MLFLLKGFWNLEPLQDPNASSENFFHCIPYASTRVQPALSPAGTVSPNFGSYKKMGLFGECSWWKEMQNAEVPGAKSRVSTLQENGRFLALETTLPGKDLEVAYCPVVWRRVWQTGCSWHRRWGSSSAWCTHTGAVGASAPHSSRNWRKRQPGGAKKTQTE